MKLYLIIVCLVLTIFTTWAFASDYNVYQPKQYSKNFESFENERILFILDFSNSMSESTRDGQKVDMMLKTMKEILPKINRNTWVGLRVYGHRMGFTPMEACRASSLVSPIAQDNSQNIAQALAKAKPRGMTPITYSLKQSIKYDFMGFNGKKHIILLTDGGENCDESPCTFVMNLIKIRKDVSIDVIAFNVNDKDDLDQLRCTALVTSGHFYNPQTSAELLKSFNNTIDRQKSVEAKIITH